MNSGSVLPPIRSTRLAVSLSICAVFLAATTACGSTSQQVDAPSVTQSQTGSSEGAGGTLPVGETVENGQALIVSASDVSEPTNESASTLVDDQAVDAFVADMDARLGDEIRMAVKAAEVPADSTLFGAVVTVGCETPAVVTWEKTIEGVQASAVLPKSSIQCLVPVTSVALFLVPEGD